MSTVHVIEHPLIKHKLTMMRDVNTCTKDFRELLGEISMLMAFEITRDLPVEPRPITTPLCRMTGCQFSSKVGVIAVLRAGLGMVSGIVDLIPTAKVGHIGLYRDPATLKPVEYYCKLPEDIADCSLVVVDPMLATGGSASAAISFLCERGCQRSNIKLVNLVGCTAGVERIQRDHPDVSIYLAAIDPELDSHGYIVPGLGDAGDRIFGTK